jgi:signal transduction histidine kinase
LGKKVKALRSEGLVPAEIYGRGVKNVHVAVPAKEFNKAFKEAGETTVITLHVGKDKHPVMVHDVVRDPLTHEIAHTAPTPADPPGGAAMLITHIADTGLGISAEAQQRLFEKFYRVQTDKTRDIQGTGLGLFIVKEIIEKMGGTIGVASEEGRGSTFSFALKVAG